MHYRRRRPHAGAVLPLAWMLASLPASAGDDVQAFAAAQTPSAPAQPAAEPSRNDSSLTWNGITLYGVVDVGLQYQTHGVPPSDYQPHTTEPYIQRNSRGSVTAVTASNLSQSRIGLAGNEPLAGDWVAVFRLETFFNPQSGDLSDGPKSLTLNNGRALTAQTTNVDSSVAGQLFAGAAYAGFSSPTHGTLTFGRHLTLLADGIAKYDPQGAAQAFALIGGSGVTAGGGVTEDRRLDQSLKYTGKFDWLHLGALYQFGSGSGSTNTAYQLQIGAEYAGFSIDGYYFRKYDAISVSPLSAANVTTLTGFCSVGSITYNPAQCWPISNSLSATVSDNQTFAVMSSYAIPSSAWKLFAGYEHIKFANPNNPLPAGSLTIGGYILAFTNNTAYNDERILQVYWGGLKWRATDRLDLSAAFYGYRQNSFATGVNAGCSSNVVPQCSGAEHSVSAVADYRLSPRFDAYLGTFWTSVQDGLSSGFLNTSTLTTTTGVRFRF